MVPDRQCLDIALPTRRTRTGSYVELAAAFYFVSIKLRVHFFTALVEHYGLFCLLRPLRLVYTRVPAVSKLTEIKLRLCGLSPRITCI